MKIIDLSHPLEHGQLNFPFDPKLSILVHNTFVTPLEWWDASWIKNNVSTKLTVIGYVE